MGVFGSLQVGSGKRFSSANKPTPPFAPDVDNAQLVSPPAPVAYQGLKTGPDFGLEYEPNWTQGIDGSLSLPRTLSPFMIRVEPPMVYAAQGDTSKKDFAGILANGHGAAPSAYQAARNAIDATTPAGALAAGGKTIETFVAGGVMHKPVGSDGIQTMNLKGDGAGRIGTPAIADLYTAVDITMQLQALVKTPPLVLLINPTTLSMKYTKKQQYTERTRYGFVFQAWGEEQPKLSIEAKCGAFISGERGVQFASRRDSTAWQNLATAFHFYRHNGYIHDTVGKSNAHHFVGALSIHYDGWVYYGNMESFNYTFEEAQAKGGIVFSMEFTVNAMVDTSKSSLIVTPMRSPVPSPSDPRYAGMDNRASPSRGDISIGGPFQTVQHGAANFQTVNGNTAGAGAPSQPPPAPSGKVQALPSDRGFRPVPVIRQTAVKPEPFPKFAPFGVGRR